VAAGVFFSLNFVLNPIIGAAIMSLSSVSVLGNALRLKLFKVKKGENDSKMLLNYKVEGMMCEHCVKSVEQALNTVKQVKHIKVDLKAKSLVVDVADNSKNINKHIIQIVSTLGYNIREA
jgi:Cu+-exporting ATPase